MYCDLGSAVALSHVDWFFSGFCLSNISFHLILNLCGEKLSILRFPRIIKKMKSSLPPTGSDVLRSFSHLLLEFLSTARCNKLQDARTRVKSLLRSATFLILVNFHFQLCFEIQTSLWVCLQTIRPCRLSFHEKAASNDRIS